jgi:pimeloyl-ACP methyl ester carboxylesterase
MTTYLSSYDPAAHKETIYTIDDKGVASIAGDYTLPTITEEVDPSNPRLFSPGLNSIAAVGDRLFVLGNYEWVSITSVRDGTYTYGNFFTVAPLVSFSPSNPVSNFSQINSESSRNSIYTTISGKLFAYGTNYYLGKNSNPIFYLTKGPGLGGYNESTGIKNTDLIDISNINQDSFFNSSTTKNIVTYGNNHLYYFFPDIQVATDTNDYTSRNPGLYGGTYVRNSNTTIDLTTKYSNQLFGEDLASEDGALPLTHLDFAINALAYDPILGRNNEIVEHRLYATAAGSNGDQLYIIDLDKIGKEGEIQKVGDLGIGYTDVNGLVFESGALKGFTKTGQQLVIDLISGQGATINEKLNVEGQLTGAAAPQDKFNIEDKGYLVNHNITSAFANSSPEIHLNLEYSGGASTKGKYGGGKIWILSHGFLSNPQTFKDENKNLVDAIHKQNPNDDIITVDWSKAANEITPGTSAQWIKEVADYTFNQLKDWGLKFADSDKVNLIGHSLGTFVSSELANNFVKGTKDIPGKKVATLTALEPASTIDSIFGGSYDLDGLKDGSQNPVRFDSVANFSRAFAGTQSLAADSTLAGTANESILMNFESNLSVVDPSTYTLEHSRVINAFTNLVNKKLDIPSLPDKLFSLDNLVKNTQFQENVFNRFSGDNLFEGIISVDANNLPNSFEAIRQGTTNDHVTYSANQLNSVLQIISRKIGDIYEFIGGAGADKLIVSDPGQTTLTGGAGGDTFVIPASTAAPNSIIEIKDFTAGQDTIEIQDPDLKSTTDGSIGTEDFGVVDSITSNNPSYSSGSSTSSIIFSQSDSQLYFNPSRTGVTLTPLAKLDGVKSISAPSIKISTSPVLLNKNTRNDFNGDGKSDILWRNTDGSASIWQMNGSTKTTSSIFDNVSTSWQVFGTGDFDSDGKSDILWRNTDGGTAIWQMNGTTPLTKTVIGAPTTDWKISGTGDFNGDGKADILWRNDDGQAAIWQMNGNTPTTKTVIGAPTTDWKIAGIGDFNADGKSDILWRNDDGSVALWQMNGTTATTQTVIGSATTDWKIAGTGDFNADGKADILWRNNDGRVAIWQMNGTTTTSVSFPYPSVDNSWKISGTSDFNGDGTSDILWKHDNGGVETWLMKDNKIAAANLVNPTSFVETSWKVAAPIL